MGSRQQKILEILQKESERDPTNTESEARKLLIRIQNYTRGQGFVSVDASNVYEKVFLGYSIEAYNLIVPELAKENWVRTWYDSPRDGRYVELTSKALELLASDKTEALHRRRIWRGITCRAGDAATRWAKRSKRCVLQR